MPYPNLRTKAQKQAKVSERMYDFAAGRMHSGTGRPGEKLAQPVSNPKQAIAIALHETGLSKDQTMHHKGSKHHAPEHKHGGHTPHHHHAHTRHMGMAEHHEMHHDGHKARHHGAKGHKHHAAHEGFAHHSPHHHAHAKTHHDGRHHDGHYNPVEHGYGFGRHHDGKTEHGASIAGGHAEHHAHDSGMHWIAGAIKHPGSFSKAAKAHHMGTHAYAEKEKHAGGKIGRKANLALTLGRLRGQKHAHDDKLMSIGGDRLAGEGESRLRSQDNQRSDARQGRGQRTGERYDAAHGDRKKEFGIHSAPGGHGIRRTDPYGHGGHADPSHEHHIAGGEHAHHEHGSGKAEHHPPVHHQEHHRFRGMHHGGHGFGHAVHNRDGHHRLSGHPGAHRIGEKRR